MKNIIKHSMITISLLSTSILADDIIISDVEAQYSGKSYIEVSEQLVQNINLGFSNTTGNTDTLNVNGKYTAAFTTTGLLNKKLKVGFDTTAYLTKNDSIVNSEEYTANLGVEQFISETWLGYGSVNWLRDSKFKNFDNKFTVGTGVGKELFNNGTQSFKIKLGLAYNIEQYADDTEELKFASLNEYIEYNYQLNPVSNFYIKVGAMEDIQDFSNNYEILTVAGLNFSVSKNISVTIEEEIRYDNMHPGTENDTDTKTIARVGYTF